MARRWGLTPSQFEALPADDREIMIAEDELVCPSCGNLRSVCSEVQGWYPQREVCYSTAAHEVTMRRLREKHKDVPATEPNEMDGMTVWMSDQDLTPDDKFI